MNKQQKELQVTELKQDFLASQASFLISFKGMSVAKMQELRRELTGVNGKLKIAKMRLVKKAVDVEGGMKELIPFLKDQLGVVFSKGDAPAVAKVLHLFSKNNETLGLVIGTLDKKLLNKSEIVEIATLPSREMLLAQLCYVLQSSIIQTVMTLDALATQREQGSNSTTEAVQ
ncbi:MAG: 50S ribosomal protein L10 [Candidatus Babeliales bacterium]|nr:50S ribosomal protein L10 [Candidatus Babeliales bacterium]